MLNFPDTACFAENHSLRTFRPAAENRDLGRSVLYVDDDWEHMSTQCAMLESAGYRVEAADSAAAGLSSYIQKGFDAVILDFHLPFVSSGLLATVMRRFRRDIPLILISDRAEFDEGELDALDRQLPRGTSQGALLENVYEVVEHGHDVYDVTERGDRRPYQDSEILRRPPREDSM